MTDRFYTRLLAWAALTGALGVMLGAFGAHALKTRLDAYQLDILKTGVLYLFLHVLATIAVALAGRHADSTALRLSGILFLSGIGLFTGSLLWLATADLTGWPTGFVGPLTPIGGLAFIGGWMSLARHAFRGR